MKVIDIQQAKIHFSQLVDEAVAGGDVVLSRAGQPLVKLVPVAEALPPRRLGTAAGRVVIHEDFDGPLEEFDGYR